MILFGLIASSAVVPYDGELQTNKSASNDDH